VVVGATRSLYEPKPFRVTFSNRNPVNVPLKLLNSTHNLCVCVVFSSPYGGQYIGEKVGEPVNFKFYDNIMDGHDTNRCFCNFNEHTNNSPSSNGIMLPAGYNSTIALWIYNLNCSNRTHLSEVDINDCEEHNIDMNFETSHQRFHIRVKLELNDQFFSTEIESNFESLFRLEHSDTVILRSKSNMKLVITDLSVVHTSDLYSVRIKDFKGVVNNSASWTTEVNCLASCGSALMMGKFIDFAGDINAEFLVPSLWSCIFRVLKYMPNWNDSKNGKIVAYLRGLDESTRLLKDSSGSHDLFLKMQRFWMKSFGAVSLQNFDILMSSPNAFHRYSVLSSILIPLPLLPEQYIINISLSQPGEFVWFYLEAVNPYEFPVTFSIVEQNFVHFGDFNIPIYSKNTKHNTVVKSIFIDCEILKESSAFNQKQTCSYLQQQQNEKIILKTVTIQSNIPTSKNDSLVQLLTTCTDSGKVFCFPLSIPSLWVAPPFESVSLGPFFLINLPVIPNLFSIYIHNNFTGFDKVDITILNDLTQISHFHLFDSTGKVVEFNNIVIYDFDNLFYLKMCNTGDVSVKIVDLHIDGINCSSVMKKRWFVFGGSSEENLKHSMCASLPIVIAHSQSLNESFSLPLRFQYNCYRSLQAYHTVLIHFDGELNDLKFRLSFEVAPSLLILCELERTGKEISLLICYILSALFFVLSSQTVIMAGRIAVKWRKYYYTRRNRVLEYSELVSFPVFSVFYLSTQHVWLKGAEEIGRVDNVSSKLGLGSHTNRNVKTNNSSVEQFSDNQMESSNLALRTTERRSLSNFELVDVSKIVKGVDGKFVYHCTEQLLVSRNNKMVADEFTTKLQLSYQSHSKPSHSTQLNGNTMHIMSFQPVMDDCSRSVESFTEFPIEIELNSSSSGCLFEQENNFRDRFLENYPNIVFPHKKIDEIKIQSMHQTKHNSFVEEERPVTWNQIDNSVNVLKTMTGCVKTCVHDSSACSIIDTFGPVKDTKNTDDELNGMMEEFCYASFGGARFADFMADENDLKTAVQSKDLLLLSPASSSQEYIKEPTPCLKLSKNDFLSFPPGLPICGSNQLERTAETGDCDYGHVWGRDLTSNDANLFLLEPGRKNTFDDLHWLSLNSSGYCELHGSNICRSDNEICHDFFLSENGEKEVMLEF
jgi:hypothetical protein